MKPYASEVPRIIGVRRSLRELVELKKITPGSASLHPGLYAAARIRELKNCNPLHLVHKRGLQSTRSGLNRRALRLSLLPQT
jgi:hypothetical protein